MVGGQGRDAKTRTELEAGGAGLAAPRGKVDPDPLANPTGIDAVADSVDLASTVLVGNHERKWHLLAWAVRPGLPVGRVHTRDADTHSDFARRRLRSGQVNDLQDVCRTQPIVDGRQHGPSSLGVLSGSR